MHTHSAWDGLRWWATLGDTDVAGAALRLLPSGRVLACHASGRPWIVGTVPIGELYTTSIDGGLLTAVGELLWAGDHLAAAARRGARDVLALPGSFQILTSTAMGVSLWTDPVGYRRAYTTAWCGLTVAGSHAGPLAALSGAGLDLRWWAARLCSPEMPSLLRERLSPYVGVRPVPAGRHLTIPTDGRRPARSVPWWTPPDGDRSLAEAAPLVGAALTTAVAGRVSSRRGPVSVQLSGGLDSTALAILASCAEPGGLLLGTIAAESPANHDTAWARRAAAALPAARHLVVEPRDAPGLFDDLPGTAPVLDEPVPHTAGAARQRHLARLLAGHGSVTHLNGQGGDEVVTAPLAYLGDVVRRDVRLAWRHVRGQAALRGMRLDRLARAALSSGSYRSWLDRVDPRCEDDPAVVATGWEAPPVMPAWATDDAVTMIVDQMRAADDPPAGVGHGRTTHATLARLRAAAHGACLYGQAQVLHGLEPAFPFLDRAVVEACLACRPWESTDPWRAKPLLVSALAPVTPTGLLVRRDKGHYTAELYAGWRRHRRHLVELLDQPVLADLGLVDAGRIRTAATTFLTSCQPPTPLVDTLAVELWLQNRPQPRPV